MKGAEEKLHMMKKVQDISDDDLDTDIIKSTKHRSTYLKKSKKAAEEKAELAEEDEGSNKAFILIIAGFVVIGLVVLAVILFSKPEKEVLTVDDLHALNLEGKLDPEQGYVFNGFSFVKFSGVWYSQLAKGETIYDVTFNNDPHSVENIPVEGQLTSVFGDAGRGDRIYVTFDPTGDYLNYVAVANFGLSRSLAWAFGYDMKAGCTKNVTAACGEAGVITCDDEDKAVIYFKEDAETKVLLEDNCVIIQGAGPEIVRSKDRLLLRWYGMMD